MWSSVLLLPFIASLTLAQSSPLLAWSSPKPFLGLDDGFSKQLGNVFFLPEFHSCGTLLILSPSSNLTSADLEDLTARDGQLKTEWEAAQTKVQEDAGLESVVVAWARGWRKTCGKGEDMREVRVAKLAVEGENRDEAIELLGTEIQTHLSALPAAPHPHLVILSSLSGASLTSLFALASSRSPVIESPIFNGDKSTSGGTLPDGSTWHSETRRHYGLWGFIKSLVRGAFWLSVIGGGGWCAFMWVKERRVRRKGRVMLPMTGDDEFLDLEAE